ncbi:MAG: winged helix-turn-helix domain-containing protein [Candidatus Korobacteraceae bacterium]
MELMPSYGTRAVRFSAFEVDLRAGELRRNGIRVKLQNQPFQILSMLLERPGEIITRDEMRARLWPAETFVDFDHGLNSAIRRLRDALGDTAENPTFVETLGGRGYRFIFPVEKHTGGDNDVSSNPGLAVVVPISTSAQPEPVSPPAPAVQRSWKLRAGLALASAIVLLSAILLSIPNSYLSRTRLGTSARHLVSKDRAVMPSAVTQRRLTANPADTPVANGVISPDGKYLAFTDGSGFYIRQVDGGETHAVPLPKGFEPLPESWFPDSVHLVVSVFHDLESKPPSLWQISILGGTPRELAEQGAFARVSPDGSKIAFLKGAWDKQEIWVMGPDGNGARRIVDGGKDFFSAVAWEADAKRFAYVRTTNPGSPERFNKQMEIFDLASGRSEVVLAERRLGDELVWTNTGRLIYTVYEPEPNQTDSNLWWVQVAASGRPTAPALRITNDHESIAGLSVAADGKRMALLRSSSQADVYLSESYGGKKGWSTPRRLTLDQREDYPATWTPDGKAVVFLSDRDGPFRIFRQNIAETQPELLVGGDDVVVMTPRSTPDGLSTLYLVTAKAGKSSANVRMMRVPVTGGPSYFVLEAPGIMNYQCARSPSTLCIYGQIEADSEYYKFFTFDPAGTKGDEILTKKVRKRDGPMNNWSLSPDGKYLVTSKAQTPFEAPVLRIFNLAENTEQYVPLPDIKLLMGMDWAPDGKSMWVGGYMGRSGGGARSGLLNVSLDGSIKVALRGLNPGVLWAIPSPDGRRLALLGNTDSSNMWLLENF